MGQFLLRWLALIAVAAASANLALAQTSPDYSSMENSTKNLVAMCNRWRVSESPLNSPARKLLGKSNDAVCRDIAAKWSPRFVEWFQAKDTPPRAFAEVCRDVAEKMAGRPVEVAWCSSWDRIPDVPIPLPAPPDEIWNALDGLPSESLAAKKARRDELLQKVVERRLSKDWDQIQVETAMEAIGLSCGVWNRKGERDLNITTATPQFTCIGNMTELVDAPSRPQVMFGRIQVSVRFAEAGETRSWQQIEVKTYEMRGRLDVLRELRRLP